MRYSMSASEVCHSVSGSQVGKSEGLRQIAMEVSLLLTRRFISLILRFISLRTLANT